MYTMHYAKVKRRKMRTGNGHQLHEPRDENLIERILVEKKKVKFKLNIPYQKLSGIESLREVLCDYKVGKPFLYLQYQKVNCPIIRGLDHWHSLRKKIEETENL